MVIFDPRKEDREVAADIRQMVADLNVDVQIGRPVIVMTGEMVRNFITRRHKEIGVAAE